MLILVDKPISVEDKNTKSYVPLISKLFLSGRAWLDEGPNDPQFCDLAHPTGMEMDGKTFE